MTSTEATAPTSGTGGDEARGIRNPVLTGFHPDPSILRVGSDYYIATSTFEWFPAVRLHHSTNLVDWTPLGGAAQREAAARSDRRRRLLRSLGTQYLVRGRPVLPALFRRGHRSRAVTGIRRTTWSPRPSPTGPWSDPVVLHGRGFDASLFHDEDGATWMLSMVADWRPGRNRFAGISDPAVRPRGAGGSSAPST